MKAQKYSVSQHTIETTIAWVNSGEIVIQENPAPINMKREIQEVKQ